MTNLRRAAQIFALFHPIASRSRRGACHSPTRSRRRERGFDHRENQDNLAMTKFRYLDRTYQTVRLALLWLVDVNVQTNRRALPFFLNPVLWRSSVPLDIDIRF